MATRRGKRERQCLVYGCRDEVHRADDTGLPFRSFAIFSQILKQKSRLRNLRDLQLLNDGVSIILCVTGLNRGSRRRLKPSGQVVVQPFPAAEVTCLRSFSPSPPLRRQRHQRRCIRDRRRILDDAFSCRRDFTLRLSGENGTRAPLDSTSTGGELAVRRAAWGPRLRCGCALSVVQPRSEGLSIRFHIRSCWRGRWHSIIVKKQPRRYR